MDLHDAVLTRRSIRRFTNGSVSEETIKKLVGKALWSPSWGNTQPWEFLAVRGDALKRLKDENLKALDAGKQANPDVEMPQAWPALQKGRYRDVGISVFESLGIGRDDLEKRSDYYKEMISFFNAQALLLITVDKSISLPYSMLDTGLFLQTFCLLAHDIGLGTCILAVSVHFPDILRNICKIEDSKRIIIGVALGEPDKEDPANKFQRKRDNVDIFLNVVS